MLRPVPTLFACIVLVAGAARAQTVAPTAETPVGRQEAPAAPAAPKPVAPNSFAPPAPLPEAAMPEADKIVLLLRSSLLTLNDALQTGNFTVLRDVAAPAFREANTAARLGAIFSMLNQQGVDLYQVAITAPQLTDLPTIDPQSKMLRLKGFFPAAGNLINFEALYQPVNGHWRLFGLSVAPSAAAAAMAAPATSGSPPSAAKQNAAPKSVVGAKKAAAPIETQKSETTPAP